MDGEDVREGSSGDVTLDRIESCEGVRGNAENLLRLFNVDLNGLLPLLLLPLDGVRASSMEMPRPVFAFGGGSGTGESVSLRLSGDR